MAGGPSTRAEEARVEEAYAIDAVPRAATCAQSELWMVNSDAKQLTTLTGGNAHDEHSRYHRLTWGLELSAEDGVLVGNADERHRFIEGHFTRASVAHAHKGSSAWSQWAAGAA